MKINKKFVAALLLGAGITLVPMGMLELKNQHEIDELNLYINNLYYQLDTKDETIKEKELQIQSMLRDEQEQDALNEIYSQALLNTINDNLSSGSISTEAYVLIVDGVDSLTIDDYQKISELLNRNDYLAGIKFVNIDMSKIDVYSLIRNGISDVELVNCKGTFVLNQKMELLTRLAITNTNVDVDSLSNLYRLQTLSINGENNFYKEEYVDSLISATDIDYLYLRGLDFGSYEINQDLMYLHVANSKAMDTTITARNLSSMYVYNFNDLNISLDSIDGLDLENGNITDSNFLTSKDKKEHFINFLNVSLGCSKSSIEDKFTILNEAGVNYGKTK